MSDRRTAFDAITKDKPTLAGFLRSLPCIEAPWDAAFQKRYCSSCTAENSKPAGFGMALSAALVSYAVVNGRKCGRTTDYMKDGKGYPLNYCPSCGKRVKNE